MDINSSSNNNNNIEHNGQMYIISSENNDNITALEINIPILEENDNNVNNESRRSHIEQFINLAQDISNNMEIDDSDIESDQSNIDQSNIDPDYQYAIRLQEQEYRLANRNPYIGSTIYNSPLTIRRLGNTNNNPIRTTLNNITNNITSFINNTRNTRNNRNLTNILNSENNAMNIRGIFSNIRNPSTNIHREIFTNLENRLRNYENRHL